MHDYRTGSTIAGFTRPREVSRKVGRIVLAIRDVPGGSTGWPLHWIESRLLSGGFASDSLSQAPAHLSGAGRHGIRRGRSDRLQHLLAVARELGAADAADLCTFVERRRTPAGDPAKCGCVEDPVGRHALLARQARAQFAQGAAQRNIEMDSASRR